MLCIGRVVTTHKLCVWVLTTYQQLAHTHMHTQTCQSANDLFTTHTTVYFCLHVHACERESSQRINNLIMTPTTVHFCSHMHTQTSQTCSRDTLLFTRAHADPKTHTRTFTYVWSGFTHTCTHEQNVCTLYTQRSILLYLLIYFLLTYLLTHLVSELAGLQGLIVVQLTYLLTYSFGIRTSRVTGTRYSLNYLLSW